MGVGLACRGTYCVTSYQRQYGRQRGPWIDDKKVVITCCECFVQCVKALTHSVIERNVLVEPASVELYIDHCGTRCVERISPITPLAAGADQAQRRDAYSAAYGPTSPELASGDIARYKI